MTGPLASGFGLRLRTALALPGAVPLAEDGAPADIEIAFGAAPDWPEARGWQVYRVVDADRFAILVPGVARFACLDRRRIVVEPAPGADPGHVAELVVATALPALLWARGQVVLHASAFLLSGATRAVAVMGASGSGKSVALARALAIGGRQLADDAIRVAVSDGAVRAAGLAGGYFERTGAAADARVFRPAPAPARAPHAPLGAILVLAPDIATPRRLAGGEAIAALLRHRHRAGITVALGTEAALLPAIAAIAQAVPVVAIPAGFAAA